MVTLRQQVSTNSKVVQAKAATVSDVKFDWRYFGDELKFHREAAGLSQQQLGDKVHCSGTYIGQFENATRRPQLPLAKLFDQALGTNGLFARMCEKLHKDSPFADHFAAASELEACAQKICEYSPLLVPGLLQTPAYARAVFRSGHPLLTDEAIDEMVAARMARARILTESARETMPELWAILDESILRRPVGGPVVMSEQLWHIVQFAEDHRIILQVVPFSAGVYALLEGMLQIMSFAEEPPVAYAEGPCSGQLLDDPAVVAKCQMNYDLLRATALSQEASLALTKTAAEEYAHAQ
ncbi:helix-turn-helix transcriptional regulator [Kitasatospora acidiphila]|uniref:Helix-turn-helix transcriptional regulator n=1 Tax=Kitasatospora acidiphila TaxID=2567942 RepID=A0A540W790_9ACTN|nr:helix-turn-helix transcriptional regulator [Kitasatospora acidiphila]TQF04853.1 helix-turn-helix transcriptional regulator [Kitasatospora acidiphila]